MSTNPYAAPRAQVADETLAPRGDFLPAGRGVPTGNGWTWITDAWSIFRAAAGTWIGIIVVLGVILIVFAFLPIIGTIATCVLGPVFTGGLMLACRDAEAGSLRFSQAFAGFSHRFGTLATVGVLYLIGLVAIVFVASLVTGVGMFTMLGGASPEQVARLGVTVLLTVLVMFALMLPLFMALWFAPALVVFHELGAWDAMKASFAGCLKNMLPFLLYGIVMMIAGVIASIPLGLGWLVLGPVIVASIYTGYRDIYFSAA
ncbi:MAG TPA: BPSS1780 family membrane protein [Burkholderiales bacterium]|jgi:uncharacterized membrane protein|nr:BPSS1780 family membrane protein [Burkholderiales bacterium]